MPYWPGECLLPYLRSRISVNCVRDSWMRQSLTPYLQHAACTHCLLVVKQLLAWQSRRKAQSICTYRIPMVLKIGSGIVPRRLRATACSCSKVQRGQVSRPASPALARRRCISRTMAAGGILEDDNHRRAGGAGRNGGHHHYVCANVVAIASM
jgi:hypothetical protein